MKKTVREKRTMGPSYAAICPNLVYIAGQREIFFSARSFGELGVAGERTFTKLPSDIRTVLLKALRR